MSFQICEHMCHHRRLAFQGIFFGQLICFPLIMLTKFSICLVQRNLHWVIGQWFTGPHTRFYQFLHCITGTVHFPVFPAAFFHRINCLQCHFIQGKSSCFICADNISTSQSFNSLHLFDYDSLLHQTPGPQCHETGKSYRNLFR